MHEGEELDINLSIKQQLSETELSQIKLLKARNQQLLGVEYKLDLSLFMAVLFELTNAEKESVVKF